MVCGKLLVFVILIAAWHDHEVESASLPLHPIDILSETEEPLQPHNIVVRRAGGWRVRGRVHEGAPPPLCARRCASPRVGPICAFDATGTARTFSTLCELEAVSCRESTYYAVSSIGEC